MYGVEVSPSLISEVTDAVMEDVRAWQTRPLEPVYMIVYLDALMIKMQSCLMQDEPGRKFVSHAR